SPHPSPRVGRGGRSRRERGGGVGGERATRGGDPSRAEGCSGYTAYPHWPGGLVRCVAPRRILMTAPFGRLMTAMVTPFTADGEVDLEQTKMLARALV